MTRIRRENFLWHDRYSQPPARLDVQSREIQLVVWQRTVSVIGALTRRRVRVCLGALWLIDAALQANPAFFTANWWRDSLAQSAMGEPAWVRASILWAVGIVAPHAGALNCLFVLAQLFIGISLVAGRFEAVAIILSVPYAFGVWWVGEGLGGIPSGFAMMATGAPGAVLLYPAIGLLAFPDTDVVVDPSPGDDVVGDGCRDEVIGQSTHKVCRPVARRAGLAVWAVVWAGQALLEVLSVLPVAQVMRANVEEYSAGNPGWLVALGGPFAFLGDHHPIVLATGLLVIQVIVGLGVLWGRSRRLMLAAGIVVAFVFWVGFEYLGGIATGGATDLNSGPLLILLGAALWPPRGVTARGTGFAAGRVFAGSRRGELVIAVTSRVASPKT